MGTGSVDGKAERRAQPNLPEWCYQNLHSERLFLGKRRARFGRSQVDTRNCGVQHQIKTFDCLAEHFGSPRTPVSIPRHFRSESPGSEARFQTEARPA